MLLLFWYKMIMLIFVWVLICFSMVVMCFDVFVFCIGMGYIIIGMCGVCWCSVVSMLCKVVVCSDVIMLIVCGCCGRGCLWLVLNKFCVFSVVFSCRKVLYRLFKLVWWMVLMFNCSLLCVLYSVISVCILMVLFLCGVKLVYWLWFLNIM